MTDDEIIAVVQAHKQGKKIQTQRIRPRPCDSFNNWTRVTDPIWDFNDYDYRVVPEPRKPREWVCFLDTRGLLVAYDHAMTFAEIQSPDTIRVREVLENE